MKHYTRRKPDKYVSFILPEDDPILPDTAKKILDGMPSFSDIVEMRITTNNGPIPTRRIGIYYTTKMPWEAQ